MLVAKIVTLRLLVERSQDRGTSNTWLQVLFPQEEAERIHVAEPHFLPNAENVMPYDNMEPSTLSEIRKDS